MSKTVFVNILFPGDMTQLQELDSPIKHTEIVWYLNKYHQGWLDFYIAETFEEARKHTFISNNPVPIIDPIIWCEANYPEMCNEFVKWQKEQYKLLCSKQMDYGPLNISMGTQLQNEKEVKAALIGIVVRANDKMQRLVNLMIVNGQQPRNESIHDTFMDLANYANIALTVMNGKWGK